MKKKEFDFAKSFDSIRRDMKHLLWLMIIMVVLGIGYFSAFGTQMTATSELFQFLAFMALFMFAIQSITVAEAMVRILRALYCKMEGLPIQREVGWVGSLLGITPKVQSTPGDQDPPL